MTKLKAPSLQALIDQLPAGVTPVESEVGSDGSTRAVTLMVDGAAYERITGQATADALLEHFSETVSDLAFHIYRNTDEATRTRAHASREDWESVKRDIRAKPSTQHLVDAYDDAWAALRAKLVADDVLRQLQTAADAQKTALPTLPVVITDLQKLQTLFVLCRRLIEAGMVMPIDTGAFKTVRSVVDKISAIVGTPVLEPTDEQRIDAESAQSRLDKT